MLETLLQKGDVKERCGVVLNDGTVVEIENIAEEPAKGFEMDPVQFLEQLKTGNVDRTWHTHPDGPPVLSGEDYTTFLAWPSLKHSIIGIDEGKVTVMTYHTEDGAILPCD